MNIDLVQVAIKASLVILAFLAAVVITKTVSRYFKLDEKVKDEGEEKK